MSRVISGLFAFGLLASVPSRADVQLPAYTRQVLPNGATLCLIPRHDVPMTSIRVLFKGGSESQPEGLSGLASVTAALIRKGTVHRSASEFAREIDSLGAGFYGDSDDQSTYIYVDFLTKDLNSALDLLVEAIASPTFPQAEVDKMLARRIEGAKSLKDNPESVAFLYYRSLLFGSAHPYGRPADELSYARITRDDIVRFHSRSYTGANMIILIAGDFDPSTAGKTIASQFATVPKGEPYAWKSIGIPSQTGRKLVIVNKPDATQTQIYLGVPGISRRDPDRIPLMLVNTVFGGRFTSVLNEALRVDQGLTYGASSFLVQSQLRGDFTTATFTNTPKTTEALNRTLQVFRGIRENGLTADQLASAKRYLKGTYAADHLETADELAGTIAEIELFGLTPAEVNDFFARVDAVTVEQANAVAAKYFRDDQVRIVLLGNAAAFRTGVTPYASVITEVSVHRPGISVRP